MAKTVKKTSAPTTIPHRGEYSESEIQILEAEVYNNRLHIEERRADLKTGKLRLSGALGLLSLTMPWEIGFWHAPDGHVGSLAAWHLVRFGWVDSDFIVSYVFEAQKIEAFEVGSAIPLLQSCLAAAGFLLVLAGSFLLLKRRSTGGVLFLASVAVWFIYIVFEFVRVPPYVILPVGALLSVIVGFISRSYNR